MLVKLPTRDYFFFFNDTATTEIYTLSLHDALPICRSRGPSTRSTATRARRARCIRPEDREAIRARPAASLRSEEHTSELQSQSNLVCRLLLEKKKHLMDGLKHCELRIVAYISGRPF